MIQYGRRERWATLCKSNRNFLRFQSPGPVTPGRNSKILIYARHRRCRHPKIHHFSRCAAQNQRWKFTSTSSLDLPAIVVAVLLLVAQLLRNLFTFRMIFIPGACRKKITFSRTIRPKHVLFDSNNHFQKWFEKKIGILCHTRRAPSLC